uniref:PPM-type phosphatase domain-containing protein n=1 Tax=Panagrolaimus sp. JU765 TaxID=591449 RepID=A0AC34RPN5_9BILA
MVIVMDHIIVDSDVDPGESSFDYGYVEPLVLDEDSCKDPEDVIVCRQVVTADGTRKLYGLINGFRNGHSVSEFVGKELLTRILYNNKLAKSDMDDPVMQFDPIVKNVMNKAFLDIDADYFSSQIDSVLAARMQIKLAADEEMTADNFEKLSEADEKISGGAVAVIALIIYRSLYVANCGNSVAILVKQSTDPNDLNAFQVSELHENHEIKEIERLHRLGLDPMRIFGPSRCFGDYFRKGGYKENPALQHAQNEPVCVDPAIFGGIEIDNSYCFLLLLSPGLVQAVLNIETERKVSEYVTQLLINHMNDAKSIKGAVQNVLQSISNDLKMKMEMKNCQPPKSSLSMMMIPLSDHILDLINPIDGTDRAVKTQSTSTGFIESYVDFSEYFADTPQAQDLRNSIVARIESLKQLYKDKKRLLHAISED